jgi:hypothetical protein
MKAVEGVSTWKLTGGDFYCGLNETQPRGAYPAWCFGSAAVTGLGRFPCLHVAALTSIIDRLSQMLDTSPAPCVPETGRQESLELRGFFSSQKGTKWCSSLKETAESGDPSPLWKLPVQISPYPSLGCEPYYFGKFGPQGHPRANFSQVASSLNNDDSRRLLQGLWSLKRTNPEKWGLGRRPNPDCRRRVDRRQLDRRRVDVVLFFGLSEHSNLVLKKARVALCLARSGMGLQRVSTRHAKDPFVCSQTRAWISANIEKWGCESKRPGMPRSR